MKKDKKTERKIALIKYAMRKLHIAFDKDIYTLKELNAISAVSTVTMTEIMIFLRYKTIF